MVLRSDRRRSVRGARRRRHRSVQPRRRRLRVDAVTGRNPLGDQAVDRFAGVDAELAGAVSRPRPTTATRNGYERRGPAVRPPVRARPVRHPLGGATTGGTRAVTSASTVRSTSCRPARRSSSPARGVQQLGHGRPGLPARRRGADRRRAARRRADRRAPTARRSSTCSTTRHAPEHVIGLPVRRHQPERALRPWPRPATRRTSPGSWPWARRSGSAP